MDDVLGEKGILLGIGTGRSGTLSLARLLDRQPGAYVTHEFQKVDEPQLRLAEPLPWYSRLEVALERLELIHEYPGSVVGDVSSSWLPYLEGLLTASGKHLRIICFERDRDQVVESFMKKTGGKHHWVEHDGTEWLADPRWDPCFPKFDASLGKREAIARYWDLYRVEAHRLKERHPTQIGIWSMEEALNTPAGMETLLTFAGIPRGEQIASRVQANVSPPWWVPEDAPILRKVTGGVAGGAARARAGAHRLLRTITERRAGQAPDHKGRPTPPP